jgi:hypothetical protein
MILVLLIVSAGCSGLLGEDQSFEATNVSVSDDVLSDAGYENIENSEYTITEEGLNDSEVTITSYLAGYEAAYDDGPGYAIALATPRTEIAGIDVNPLGDLDKSTLAAEVMSRSNEIETEVNEEDLQRVGDTEATVLDTETNVTTFETTVELSNEAVDTRIHVTRVQDGDDHIIAVGVHPAAVDGAQSDIITLFEGIEHDAGE